MRRGDFLRRDERHEQPESGFGALGAHPAPEEPDPSFLPADCRPVEPEPPAESEGAE